MREADEEIGLAADRIEPLGYLDLYLTTFGFRIVPPVARVAPGFALTLNPRRGRLTLRGAARLLMSPAEPSSATSRDWNGLTRHFYEMPFGERYIWGADGGNSAKPLRQDLSMIRPALTELLLFIAPFALTPRFCSPRAPASLPLKSGRSGT